MKDKKTVARIVELYREYGNLQYGENVTQLQHALQAAELAITDGRDDEMIAAAFLHGIGHFLPGVDEELQGENSHEVRDRIVANYLSQCGFSERVVGLAGNHVQAKRYLCAIEAGYFDQLARGSKESLVWQGGVMSVDEISDFSSRSDLEEILAMRRYHEMANEPEKSTHDLHYIEAILDRVLSHEAAVA